MKQVLQNLRSGVIELADVPCPLVRPGHLLIQTTCSLISPGTERSLVEFGQAGLIGKARAQPEKVRQVLEKIRTDGLIPTLETVFSRLDEPLPLGYCNVGRIIEIGPGVSGFRAGDRVASNGPHAEIVHVPATLAARVPDSVSDEAASFTVLGAIALHGVRLVQPTFGECFAVVGLGLVGLLTAQLLRAHGCRVIALDTNPARCERARQLGCHAVCVSQAGDPVTTAVAYAGGGGVDGVVIAAAADSDEIIHQAAQMCRKRGRIVLVGVVGLNLRRNDFYEKELTFQVSCSYGPGRHDATYEREGRDYPLPYVRWTVARNFEAVLNALGDRRLEAELLISHRLPHLQASEAYQDTLSRGDALGVLLTYPADAAPNVQATVQCKPSIRTTAVRDIGIGVIGAGQFAKRVLLPEIRRCGFPIRAVVSATGVSGVHAARKFAAEQASTDYRQVLDDPSVNVVFIATRHDSHARMVVEALEHGKHVFVEKPLATDEDGLDEVRAAHRTHPDLQLMVGFNRRFAPHAVKVRELLDGRTQPVAARIMVNAGTLPGEHWTNDPVEGGGRIIGEACHFVDLLSFLVGRPLVEVSAIGLDSDGARASEDTVSISLRFADGSLGAVDYWCNGPRSFPKERVEVFSAGRGVVIDNWRRLVAYDWPGTPNMRIRQDKGSPQEVAMFLQRVSEGGASLIPFDELDQSTMATFAAVKSLRERRPVSPQGTLSTTTALAPQVLVS